MISIYNFNEYRGYVRARFAAMNKGGYGQSLKMAEHLGVHTTLVSQVLKGGKTFTLEQGSLAADFLGLTEDETDFFLLLIQEDRAASPALKKNLARQKEKFRQQSRKLENRLIGEMKLTEEKKAIFYSDWIYSAVRQLTAIEGYSQPEQIAAYFGLTNRKIREVVDFLLTTDLLQEKNGKLAVGVRTTQLESGSPWINARHGQWRQRAIEGLHREDPVRMHYTCPMTLSVADAQKVREQIIKLLESVDKIIDPSPSEELRCLNIDWFKV
jgi:uncharacterized protein (TIGR02147 family)